MPARLLILALLGILGLCLPGGGASAEEYRLQVANLYSDRGDLWGQYLSRSVSVTEGLAAVVGINDNPSFADWVYLVVEHPARPTTFKAVLGWERRRSADRSNFEGPVLQR